MKKKENVKIEIDQQPNETKRSKSDDLFFVQNRTLASPDRYSELQPHRSSPSPKDHEIIEKQCRELLYEWHKFCEKQSTLHSMCQSHFRIYGSVTSISAILLSSLGGASSIATSSIDHNKYFWLPILFGGLGLISAALMSVNRFLNFPELQRAHTFYSTEYIKLKNEIHMQLFIHRSFSNTYSSIIEFTKICKRDLDSIMDRAPTIRGHIIDKFEKNKKYFESKRKKGGSWYVPSILFNQNTVI